MKKHLIYYVSILIFSIILCGASSAATIKVNNSTGIQNAINTAHNGDTLNLSAGTYKENNITVNKNLTITGPKTTSTLTAVVDAQQKGRVFIIPSGITVTLQYLLIQNGNDSDYGAGGGIDNTGNLTITNSKVYNNSAGQYGYGGGIYNDGVLNLTNSTIQKNTAGHGGGIYNCGTLTVTGSNIYNNTGIGIYSYNTLTVTSSNVSYNTEDGIDSDYEGVVSLTDCNIFKNNGNGIDHSGYNNYYYCLGTLALTNCNVYNNTGNGINNWQGDVTVTDCDVYNNTGSGIYNEAGDMTVTGSNIYKNGNDGISNYDSGNGLFGWDKGRMTIERCNIYNNTGDGIYNDGEGGGYVIVRFSRIIGNTDKDIYCYDNSVNAQNNWWGSNQNPSSRVYGNVNVTPWLILNLTADPNLVKVNGASTITASLTYDSNGEYHDPWAGCVPNGLPVTFNATLGTIGTTNSTTEGTAQKTFNAGTTAGMANISAKIDNQTIYTLVNIRKPISTIYVNSSSGNDAWDGEVAVWQSGIHGPIKSIQNAIFTIKDGGIINIANGIYKGENNTNIIIDKNLTIKAQNQTGTIINGGNLAQIFIIRSGLNVTIQNLTFINCTSTDSGGAIYNDQSNLTINNCSFTSCTANSGGAIYNRGAANIENSNIYNNTANGDGDGIYNSGAMTLTSSNIYNNDGCGIYNIGILNVTGSKIYNNKICGISNSGNVNLYSSNIYNNVNSADGGGIYNSGTVTLTNSNVYNNTAYCGAGIMNYDNSNLCLIGSNIYNNTATSRGGGIYNSFFGSVTLTNSNIHHNSAGEGGGGIENYSGNLNATGSNIFNNNATYGGGIRHGYGSYLGYAATLISCGVYNNTATEYGGGIYNDRFGTFTLSFCRIIGNTAPSGTDVYCDEGVSVDASLNWWGLNQDPSSKVYGNVNVSPWLVLNVTANPNLIKNGNTSNITANLCCDSNGGYHDPANGHVPDGMPVIFTTTLGTINSPLSTVNGYAKAILNSGAFNGVASVTTTLDSQTVHTSVNIIDTIPPTVTTSDPTNGAVNVARDKVIKITFSEPIKAGTMWIELYNTVGTKTLIPITTSISGNVLTINHAALLANGTKYTLCLHSGSVTDMAGNSLTGVARYFTTSTDAAAPVISGIDPVNNAVNIARDKVITVTFNEPVKAGNMWIELYNTVGTKTLIPITTSISGNVLTIKHTTLLANGTKYTLAFSIGSVTDLAGNSLTGVAHCFTTSTDATVPTVTSSDPVNNAVNVARNKAITVTFNEPIKSGTMWIELYNTTGTKTLIPITTSISGNVLTINHAALLANGTKYTLCLHSGSVTDLAGNSLTGEARYFTTSTDGTSPTITSTDPANNAVNVPRNKAITVTFNEPIKAGNMWIELYNTTGTKTPIPITTTISGYILTINHAALLATGTKYTLAFHSGSITDNAGNSVASAVRYFTTGTT